MLIEIKFINLNFFIQLFILKVVSLSYENFNHRFHYNAQACKLGKLVQEINFEWNFNSIFIIHNNKTTTKRYLNDFLDYLYGDKSNHYSNTFLPLPLLIISEEFYQYELYKNNGLKMDSLVLTFMENLSDDILNVTIKATRHKRHCFTIYIVKKQTGNLYDFFAKLWHYQMQRPLVIIKTRYLFTVEAYPKLKVLNVTEKAIKTFFPALKTTNFQGYNLRVPVQIELPTIYWYNDSSFNTLHMDGIAGRLLEEFMLYMNVTMILYPLYINHSNYLNMSFMKAMLLNGSSEIDPHINNLILPKDDFDSSYPYMINSYCVMIPYERTGLLDVYIWQLFHWTFWLLLFSYFTAQELLALVLFVGARYGNLKFMAAMQPYPMKIRKRFLSFLLGIPPPAMKKTAITVMTWKGFIRLIILNTIAFICGFYISQLFSTNLTSLLAYTVFKEPQLSFDNIAESKHAVMIKNQEIDFVLHYVKCKHEADKCFVSASNEVVHNHLFNLNTSYLYIVTMETFQFIDEQQKFLPFKRFWLSKLCFGMYWHQFHLRGDSHFQPFLDLFIMRVHEGGIGYYWQNGLFYRTLKTGNVKYEREAFETRNYLQKTYSSNMLSMIVLILMTGLLFGVFVFILEYYWFKLPLGLREFLIKINYH